MKQLIFFCITLLICFSCSKSSDSKVSKQDSETSNDTKTIAAVQEEVSENFYVMVPSGLKLREKPNGDKIKTIPYRAEVERIGMKTFGTLEVEEVKGLKVKGDWIKVRYKGKEGYVFNGFLTKYKMPKQVKGYDYEKYNSIFDYYLTTTYDKDGDKYNVEKMKDCIDENPIHCYMAYTQDYQNGDIKYHYEFTGTSLDENLTFRGMTLIEAYFLIKAMDLNGASNTEYDVKEIITYDKTKNMISFEVDGAGCYSDIKEEGDDVVISIFCGC